MCWESPHLDKLLLSAEEFDSLIFLLSLESEFIVWRDQEINLCDVENEVVLH